VKLLAKTEKLQKEQHQKEQEFAEKNVQIQECLSSQLLQKQEIFNLQETQASLQRQMQNMVS
jgi:hypothetical protein